MAHSNVTEFDGLPQYLRAVYISLLAVIGTLILACNGLFIAAYCRSPKSSSLRNKANHLLVHLAVADLLIGAGIPYHITMYSLQDMSLQPVYCAVRYISIMFPMTASIAFIFLISIDRFLAIQWPLKYRVYITRTVIHLSSAFMWILSISVGLIGPIFTYKSFPEDETSPCEIVKRFKPFYFNFIFIPCFFVTQIIVIVSFILIFLKVKFQDKVRKNSTTGNLNQRCRRQHMRILLTGFIVCGTFFICWVPFYLILSVQIYLDKTQDKDWHRARTVATFLALSNSFMNFFIYMWRIPVFLKAVKSTCLHFPMVSQTEDSRSSNTSK